MRWVVTAVLLAGAGTVSAKALTSPELTVPDRKFIEKVASDNMADLKLARLAIDKSANETVRDYARMIIDQRQELGQKLDVIAVEQGFPEPTSIDTLHQQVYDQLASLEGDTFDRAFLQVMKDDHEQEVRDFDKATTELKNPELKKLAISTLPSLKQHEARARRDLASIKVQTM